MEISQSTAVSSQGCSLWDSQRVNSRSPGALGMGVMGLKGELEC